MLGEIISIRIIIYVQGINIEDYLILKVEYEKVQWIKIGIEFFVVYIDG